LNARDISYIVSYDGRTGEKVHGRSMPRDLRLRHIELEAGRSSQETLLGREAVTYESLYLSPALTERLNCGERLHNANSESSAALTGLQHAGSLQEFSTDESSSYNIQAG